MFNSMLSWLLWANVRLRAKLGLRPMKRSWALKNVIDVTEVLDDAGVTHWLSDGTLLGAVRENDFIRNDTDIDIGVLANTFRPSVIDELLNRGFRIGHLFGFPDKGMEISLLRYGIPVDLFFFYPRGTGIYGSVYFDFNRNSAERMDCEYPAVTPVRRQFLGRSFWIPDDVGNYLALGYGPNWTKPDANWDYTVDPPNTTRPGVRIDTNASRRSVEGYLFGK